jgi:adenosine kinase
MSKPQVIICGSIAIDRIMNFSGRYRDLIKPEKLHALSLSVLLDKLENSPGGIGANIAYNLAILGEKPVLLGSVGQDAKDYMSALTATGVDTSQVHFSDLPTASFTVMTDSEDSQVGGFYPGAMADSAGLSFKSWQGQNALAVISAHDPAAMNRQVAECQQAGIPYVYDPGQQVADQATDHQAGLEAAAILVVNDYELGLLSERVGLSAEQLKANLPVVITTLGADGSVIEGREVPEPIKIGVAKPRQAADPTGAGDGYRAGFLYGYVRQWDLKKCGQLGAVVASFIVEKHGTQVKFTAAEVAARYQENFNEEIKL